MNWWTGDDKFLALHSMTTFWSFTPYSLDSVTRPSPNGVYLIFQISTGDLISRSILQLETSLTSQNLTLLSAPELTNLHRRFVLKSRAWMACSGCALTYWTGLEVCRRSHSLTESKWEVARSWP